MPCSRSSAPAKRRPLPRAFRGATWSSPVCSSPTAGARSARAAKPAAEPWRALLDLASEAGEEAGAAEERRLLEEAESAARRGRKGKLTREAIEQVRRTERRARTRALDLALALCCDWYRDLAAVAAGADDVVLNADRLPQLREDATGLDPAGARAAVEWVLDTRRRMLVNVSEELALEALWLRLRAVLAIGSVSNR
jgi:DNA polymerase III subunit delta'